MATLTLHLLEIRVQAIMRQVEILRQVITLRVEILLRATMHQVETLRQVIMLRAEILLRVIVRQVEVHLRVIVRQVEVQAEAEAIAHHLEVQVEVARLLEVDKNKL